MVYCRYTEKHVSDTFHKEVRLWKNPRAGGPHIPLFLLCAWPVAWDANGDGIGDFEWYGLVAQDWFDVDPLYGTMKDFDRLINKEKVLGLKILKQILKIVAFRLRQTDEQVVNTMSWTLSGQQMK